MIRIAILDDYQNVALEMADWSRLAGRAEITVFNDHLYNLDALTPSGGVLYRAHFEVDPSMHAELDLTLDFLGGS